MSSTVRQQKFSRLIQKELSDIFQRDQRGLLSQAFITIVDVRVSPDLGLAKIYISMMLEKDKKAMLDKIDSHKSEIRKALGDRIRNQVRIIPELAFFVDDVDEKAQRMDDLLKGLSIPPSDQTEE